jgi:hypothetical protein
LGVTGVPLMLPPLGAVPPDGAGMGEFIGVAAGTVTVDGSGAGEALCAPAASGAAPSAAARRRALLFIAFLTW